MPRIVGPCLLHSTIPIFFKNPGGFEFLGSMSFNQTELGRERETTPGGGFRRMGHVRLRPRCTVGGAAVDLIPRREEIEIASAIVH